MKKTVQKMLMCLLAGMMVFSTAACGGSGDNGGDGWGNASTGGNTNQSDNSGSGNTNVDEPIEGVTNPYKLKVYSFTGGYGEEWLNSLVVRYKKARAGKEFYINGVKYDGVDFDLAKEKETMTNLMNKNLEYDVWFQEQVFYNQLINANVFHDMTDVLTSDNPYEPGVTLESKMSDYQKEYYKRDTDGDGVKDTYYGIPHYAGYVGLTYNKWMFDERGWYFKKGYNEQYLTANPQMCIVGNTGADKAAGPDGVEGTSDDGLPTTYDEYFALCKIISYNCKAITWPGGHLDYLNWFMTSLAANAEGLDQMSLNYSFDGTATNLISVADDGTITDLPAEKITKDNGYILAQQAGKYYALKFLENIVDRGYQDANADNDVCTQTKAQKDFILSTGAELTDSAMIVEGVWWEMESKQTFDTIMASEGYDARDDFAWMPLPMPTKELAAQRAANLAAGKNGYTLTDTHNSLAFIGKQVSDEVYELAKDFIQFANTDESLAEFSIITDTTKALNYTMKPEQKAQMSSYGQSLVAVKEKSDIVYTFSQNAFYRANEASFSEYKTNFASIVDGNKMETAVNEFKKGMSAEKYFGGLHLYQQDKWTKLTK